MRGFSAFRRVAGSGFLGASPRSRGGRQGEAGLGQTSAAAADWRGFAVRPTSIPPVFGFPLSRFVFVRVLYITLLLQDLVDVDRHGPTENDEEAGTE